MAKRRPKRPLIRVQTEKSQGPWNRTKKQSDKDDIYRQQANRIVELEAAVARAATRNHGGLPMTIHITTAMTQILNTLTGSGLWGRTREETAAMMIAERCRIEIMGTPP